MNGISVSWRLSNNYFEIILSQVRSKDNILLALAYSVTSGDLTLNGYVKDELAELYTRVKMKRIFIENNFLLKFDRHLAIINQRFYFVIFIVY